MRRIKRRLALVGLAAMALALGACRPVGIPAEIAPDGPAATAASTPTDLPATSTTGTRSGDGAVVASPEVPTTADVGADPTAPTDPTAPGS